MQKFFCASFDKSVDVKTYEAAVNANWLSREEAD